MRILILGLFLLCSNVLFSQKPPLLGELYDFNVGDEFHYYVEINYSGPPILYTTTILGKFQPSASEVQYYAKIVKCYLPQIPGSWVTEISYDTLFYMNLFNPLLDIDSIFTDALKYNGDTIYEVSDWGFDTGESSRYVKGLGLVEYFYSDGMYTEEGQLVYYKKGTEEWGDRLYIGIEESHRELVVTVVPNPVLNVLHIQWDSGSNATFKYKIYNLSGVLAMEGSVEKDEMIDVHQLVAGTYFIQVQNNLASVTRQFIKE